MNISMRQKNYLFPVISFILIIFLTLVVIAHKFLPVNIDWSPNGPFSIGVDWKGWFRVAALKAIHLQNPYQGSNPMQNPPWLLIFTIPVALLPSDWGAAVMFIFTFFGYGLVCFRLGIKPWSMVLFFLLPLVWECAINGNIDWLVAIGFTLPPQIGLFFVLLKPQLSVGIVLFWIWQAWKIGGFKQVFKVFYPATICILLSFIIFGFWPMMIYSQRMADPYNASSWPLTAALGIVLLYYALKNNNQRLAISVSPFLSPYITIHGYAIAFLGLENWPLALSVIGYWAAQIYKFF